MSDYLNGKTNETPTSKDAIALIGVCCSCLLIISLVFLFKTHTHTYITTTISRRSIQSNGHSGAFQPTALLFEFTECCQ